MCSTVFWNVSGEKRTRAEIVVGMEQEKEKGSWFLHSQRDYTVYLTARRLGFIYRELMSLGYTWLACLMNESCSGKRQNSSRYISQSTAASQPLVHGSTTGVSRPITPAENSCSLSNLSSNINCCRFFVFLRLCWRQWDTYSELIEWNEDEERMSSRHSQWEDVLSFPISLFFTKGIRNY